MSNLQGKAPRVFLVSRFDREYQFVFRWLERHFSENHELYSVSGRYLELVSLDVSAHDLRHAIIESITQSCLILVDITPVEIGENLLWNPNVFYELGRADQVKVPVFRFCDARFQERVKDLPFDIRTSPVYWYEVTPTGLDKLCKDLDRWYGNQNIGGYFNAIEFMNSARVVRDRVLEWPSVGSTQFQVVINEFLKVVHQNVEGMTHYIAKKKIFSLKLPDPKEMIDLFLSETMKTMGPGDHYFTFSCPAFLDNLGRESRFHEELIRRAHDRELTAQRLILVGDDDEIAPGVETVLREHEDLSQHNPSYSVRFLLCGGFSHEDKRHSGICRWETKNEIIVFKPKYQSLSDHIVLSGVDYDSTARWYVDNFQKTWENGEVFTSLDQCLDKRQVRRKAQQHRRAAVPAQATNSASEPRSENRRQRHTGSAKI